MQSRNDKEIDKEQERAGWGARAESYSKVTARATVQAIPALLHTARLTPFSRVLDVACGPGYAAGAAAALGCSALGVDLSGEMVAVARARQLDADFEIGDAEALRSGANVFDHVVCNFGVFHFPAPEKAFAEALRVLKPGGRYAFSQWRGPQDSAFFGAVMPAVAAHAGAAAELAGVEQGFRLSDPGLCCETLRRIGFEAVESMDMPVVFRAPRGDLLPLLSAFAVRLAPVIERLAPEARAAVRDALDQAVAPYRTAAGLEIPTPAFIVSGSKP